MAHVFVDENVVEQYILPHVKWWFTEIN